MKHSTKIVQVPVTTHKEEKELTIVLNEREAQFLIAMFGPMNGYQAKDLIKNGARLLSHKNFVSPDYPEAGDFIQGLYDAGIKIN